MSDTNTHPQCQSKLMSAPPEIRRVIYAPLLPPHVHLSKSAHGRLRLSTCLEPPVGVGIYSLDPNEPVRSDMVPPGFYPGPKSSNSEDEDPRNVIRLRSPWGPHCPCEETARMACDSRLLTLLTVCKKMFVDVCDIIADTGTIEVTDLGTLDAMTRGAGGSLPWVAFTHIAPRVHNISVTLRLPMAFCRALEAYDDDLLAVASRHAGTVSEACKIWARVWPAVSRLPHLRHLSIWMDHDDAHSWSIVGERAVVSRRLMDVLAKHLDSSTCSSPIDVRFNLPKLHPGIATPEKHFVDGSTPLPRYTILRRYRQRCFYGEKSDGTPTTVYQSDFPVLHPLAYLSQGFHGITVDDLGISQESREMADKEMTDIERWETEEWERGTTTERLEKEYLTDPNSFPNMDPT